MGKEELGGAAGRRLGAVEPGRAARSKVNSVFYSSSVGRTGGRVWPPAPPMIPPSAYHPRGLPAHTLASLDPHSFL